MVWRGHGDLVFLASLSKDVRNKSITKVYDDVAILLGSSLPFFLFLSHSFPFLSLPFSLLFPFLSLPFPFPFFIMSSTTMKKLPF
jgi:hypothetical protein